MKLPAKIREHTGRLVGSDEAARVSFSKKGLVWRVRQQKFRIFHAPFGEFDFCWQQPETGALILLPSYLQVKQIGCFNRPVISSKSIFSSSVMFKSSKRISYNGVVTKYPK